MRKSNHVNLAEFVKNDEFTYEFLDFIDVDMKKNPFFYIHTFRNLENVSFNDVTKKISITLETHISDLEKKLELKRTEIKKFDFFNYHIPFLPSFWKKDVCFKSLILASYGGGMFFLKDEIQKNNTIGALLGLGMLGFIGYSIEKNRSNIKRVLVSDLKKVSADLEKKKYLINNLKDSRVIICSNKSAKEIYEEALTNNNYINNHLKKAYLKRISN